MHLSWYKSSDEIAARDSRLLELLTGHTAFPARLPPRRLHSALCGCQCLQVTAAQNFTHLIQTERRPQHRLVTGGIYSRLRHPGYAGGHLKAGQEVACRAETS